MNKRTPLANTVVTVILLSLSHPLLAGPAMTLREMVEKVITSNPEVQAKYHEYTAAGFDVDNARGNYLPKADITGTYRRQENVDDGISRRNGTAIPRFNSELVLRQMIFDGFATPSEVKRLSHAERVRYYELQSAMQNTTLEFMRSYIDILREQELTEYAKTNYIIHKQYFDKIKERVDAGVARRVDLEQATGRLALAEANLLTETTNLYDASTRVQRLLGEIPGDGLEHPELSKSEIQANAEDALRLAYASNPDILATTEDIQATTSEVRTKKSRYLPRFDLQARKNIDHTSDGDRSTAAADVVELTMNWNIFNGLSDKAAVNQNVEKLNRSYDLRDKACIDTRQLVNLAYNDIYQLKQQLTFRDQHRKSIENAREAYRKQFDIGQRTLLDLLDSENEYFQARRSYTNTYYDIENAYARLYAAQGQLVTRIGSQREGLPALTHADYEDAVNICKAVAPVQINIDKEALLANAEPLAINTRQIIKPLEKPAQIPKSDIPDKVVPDVQFETNSAIINPVSYPVLDNAIKILNQWGNSGVEVAGHTDRRESSDAIYNQRLSEARAQAVSDYLVLHGIDKQRLIVKGYGFDHPVADNDPIKGNELNRRVELIRQK